VVHVAALDGYFGGLADAGFAAWRQVLDVNLIGTLQLTRACLPALRERGGSVVIIGTQSAVAAPSQVRQAAYAASKGALTSAMYSLARELGPERIRVNTVLPGWMWGPAVESYVSWTAGAESVPEDDVRVRLTERMALPEPATDGEVAEAALFSPRTGHGRAPASPSWSTPANRCAEAPPRFPLIHRQKTGPDEAWVHGGRRVTVQAIVAIVKGG